MPASRRWDMHRRPCRRPIPTIPLIVGGSLGSVWVWLFLLALLIELLNRRVRGAEDLQSIMGVPLLTVLEAAR